MNVLDATSDLQNVVRRVEAAKRREALAYDELHKAKSERAQAESDEQLANMRLREAMAQGVDP